MSSASRGCTTRGEEIRRASTRARGDRGRPRSPEASHAHDVTDRISGTGATLGPGRPSAPPEAAGHDAHTRGGTGEPHPRRRRPRTAAGRCRLTGSSVPHRSRAWSRFETGKSAETSPSRPQRPMATGMHLERTGHGGRARQGEVPDPTSPRRSCPWSRRSVVSSGTREPKGRDAGESSC